MLQFVCTLPYQLRVAISSIEPFFWLDIASRQWTISASASFAAVVSAVEALTEGNGPGATRRFIDFFDTYSPGAVLEQRRRAMYRLRSAILHGSKLMELDEVLAFGLRPGDWAERDLQTDLWQLTNSAVRNWLKSPG
jgi:hypothetical protein